MDNQFSINNVNIIISSVVPLEVLPTYGNYTNYVKSVSITYNLPFRDITAPSLEEDPYFPYEFKETVNISYELKEEDFGEFISYDNITKEMFYPIAIAIANESEEISNKVRYIRIRTGLDSDTPRAVTNIVTALTYKPFA